MSKAVYSHSTGVPTFHSIISLNQHFECLSSTSKMYREYLQRLLVTCKHLKIAPDNAVSLLEHVLQQLDGQDTIIKDLIKQFVVFASDEVNGARIKALRNRFITELLENGFSSNEIAQNLNLNHIFIKKLAKKIFEEEAEEALSSAS